MHQLDGDEVISYAIAIKGFKFAAYLYVNMIEISKHIHSNMHSNCIPLTHAISFNEFIAINRDISDRPRNLQKQTLLYNTYLNSLPNQVINLSSEYLKSIDVE